MAQISKIRVKELLDLYFEGSSTLEQEKLLRLYFASGDVDAEFAEYAPLFDYFNDEIEKLDNTVSKRRRYWIKPRVFYTVTSVAAIVAFTLLFWPKAQENSQLKLVMDGIEVKDDQAAIAMADDQLSKMSSMMQNVDSKTSALDKLGSVKEAITGFNDITNKIK